MSRQMHVPPQVAEVIGAARAAELVAGPYPVEIRCIGCHWRGRLDKAGPTIAGVDLHPGATVYVRVWFAHVGCAPPEGPVRAAGPMTLPDLADAAGVLFAVAGGGPAVLVELYSAWLAPVGPAGAETIDLLLNALGATGLSPARDLGALPVPGEQTRWRVQLPRPGHGGGVYGRAPDGARIDLLEPLPPVPPSWPALTAMAGGRCRLYVASRAGLIGLEEPQFWARAAEMAAAGRIVGTTAAVVP